MIKLELNIKEQTRTIELADEILFNALLSQNQKLICKLIKTIHPLYKISDAFFDIVTKRVDINAEGKTLYGGFIVRTSFDNFAVLYLKDTEVDDDYIVSIVDEYLKDTGENVSMTVNINKFEIDKPLFLKAMR